MLYFVQFVFRDGKMDEERLKQLVKLTGKSRLVLDLSCRKKVNFLLTCLLYLSTKSISTFALSFHSNLLEVWQACGDLISFQFSPSAFSLTRSIAT